MNKTIIKPTFFFHVVGCKVNQVEAAMLKKQFEQRGFCYVENKQEALLVLLHTCTVTHKADRDCRRFIEHIEKQFANSYLIITGCLAALEKEQLQKHHQVLAVIDQQDRYQTAEIAIERLKDAGIVPAGITSRPIEFNPGFFSQAEIEPYSGRARAFIKIQDGCNGACSYCRVRLARGKSMSREQGGIIKEIQSYLKQGYQEVVLTGVNLGSWEPALENLFDEIAPLTTSYSFRIRLSSIEPQHLNPSLMEKLVQHQKWLCPHLHIPIQSGADDILKVMKRTYQADFMKEQLLWLKKHWPGLALTADIIVGFPGESEQDYEKSCELAKLLQLSCIHVFPFSLRPGTEAVAMPGQLVNRVITERAKKMRLLSHELKQAHLKKAVGKEAGILLEQEREDGYWTGTTGDYERAIIKIKGRAGQLINGTISGIEEQLLLVK